MGKWLACAALVLAACGGGGGSGGGGPNVHEQQLVGGYTLGGFDVYIGGDLYTEEDFASWSGSLSLYDDATADIFLRIEDEQRVGVGVDWAADADFFYSDGLTASYSYGPDGFGNVLLIIDHINPSGFREVDYWVLNP